MKEFTKRRKYREHSFHFTFPREGKGWVPRYAPALRGGGFELLLDYNWIIERGVLLCGPWAVGAL